MDMDMRFPAMRNTLRMQSLVALLCCLFPAFSYSQQAALRVSSVAWHGLTTEEKAFIQSRYLVEAMGSESFGIIIDNQGVDRSTPGTTGGAALGGAIANAAYVDKAFSGNNDYSAKTHLAVMLLGGFLGSSLDSRSQAKYHYRYAVRLGNGSVAYHDQVSQDPFRHPVGVCVSIPAMTLLPEQHLCTQSAESLRQAHIPQGANLQSVATALPDKPATTDTPAQVQPEVLINCKANNLAVVRTTQGVIIQ